MKGLIVLGSLASFLFLGPSSVSNEIPEPIPTYTPVQVPADECPPERRKRYANAFREEFYISERDGDLILTPRDERSFQFVLGNGQYLVDTFSHYGATLSFFIAYPYGLNVRMNREITPCEKAGLREAAERF